MRKSERRRQRAKMISGGVVVLLMIFGAVGFAVSFHGGGVAPHEQTFEYGEYTFRLTNQGYTVNINGQTASFQNYPGSLEFVEIPQEAKNRLRQTRMIQMTSDPTDPLFSEVGLAQFQFEQELAALSNVFTVIALSKNSTYQLPIVTCEDATVSAPVLDFRPGNNTEIRMEGDCIVLEAPTQSTFVRLKDRLLFTMLGVME